MARGGAREGAGRKPDPNSKRQQALARKAGRAQAAPVVPDRTLTLPNGEKSPDAPAWWPFGTKPADPPAAAPPPAAAGPKRQTAREFLADLVNDVEADAKLRLDAAKKLIEFEEAKPAPMGKKASKVAEAGKVAGKFAAAAPPKLVVANGNRVS